MVASALPADQPSKPGLWTRAGPHEEGFDHMTHAFCPTRTGLMGLAAAMALFAAPVSAQAETAKGTVFEDRNGNGVQDQGEPGVEGVLVSNGRDVTKTGADGGYRIGLDKRDVLFITKPAGYAVPVDDAMIPQFYYIHDPDGTPDALALRYEGVAPTGPLPDEIDFPLTRVDEPDTFAAVLFADTQPQTFKELEYIRDDVVGELVGVDAAFGITAGDILFDDMSMFPRYNRIIGQIGVPWYNVPGNHELNFLSPDDDYSLETFKRFFGPTNYSFDVGQAHFVVMDNVQYQGKKKPDDENPHPRQANGYTGRLSKEQLTWLKRNLAQVPADKLIVLVMHIPLMNSNDPEAGNINLVNRDDLFAILKDRRHVVSFAGHLHMTEVVKFGREHGFPADRPLHHHTLATVSGAWWSGPRDVRGIPQSLQSDGVPNGYYIMTVSGTDVTVRYKAAGRPADHQMRIMFDSQYHRYSPNAMRDYALGELLGSPISVDQVHATEVVVNVFNGGPESEVTLTVDGSEPVPMERRRMPDPLAQELIARHADQYKDWVRPWPVSHIWVARLPRNLKSGTHTVSVTAVDAYGVTHTGHRVLEIVGHD